ncbi:MAG: winged helix-turn-helix domain-containing protein, partial [Actinomycetota bacterium]
MSATEPSLRIRVLGPVRLEGVDQDLAPGLRRLLAGLTVHRGRLASADRLTDALWPDGPPGDDGLRALRTAVSRLRKVVGGDVVVTDAPGYRLAGVHPTHPRMPRTAMHPPGCPERPADSRG